MRKIMILLNSKGKIPQKLHETQSLNINYLTQLLDEKGFEVSAMTYHSFQEMIKEIDCSEYIFIYASSQYEWYKEYIEDILIYIKDSGGEIIPSFQMFRSHENKSYQEFYKTHKKIEAPEYHVIGTFEEGLKVLEKTNFPIIGKSVTGFASKGVEQINSINEGVRFLNKNLRSGIKLDSNGMRVLGRRIKFKNQYPRKSGRVVFQSKITDVDHDWKVLVFGDSCFCLKRSVRKNDFRASGSGIFNFDAVPSDSLLDFAYSVKNKLNTPWVSLDIMEKDSKCYLIEYQAVHFGLSTLINNKYLYKYDKKEHIWVKKEKQFESEYYFVDALIDYLQIKNTSENI